MDFAEAPGRQSASAQHQHQPVPAVLRPGFSRRKSSSSLAVPATRCFQRGLEVRHSFGSADIKVGKRGSGAVTNCLFFVDPESILNQISALLKPSWGIDLLIHLHRLGVLELVFV